MSLTKTQQTELLSLARKSIQHGLLTGKALTIDIADYAGELIVPGATFVTLEKQGQLRGCIGMLQAIRPLVEDVSENAFAAAFCDRRFLPLSEQEFNQIQVHISILSPAEPIIFSSEQDLVTQLRPGIDGLILEEGHHRATFLPSVWESLTEPNQFLQNLKQKAGLSSAYWSNNIKAYRYTADYIE